MSTPTPTLSTFLEADADPRWTTTDHYTTSHLHPLSRHYHEILTHSLTNSHAHNLPDIASNLVLAKFLALQCRASAATHALEVGTLGGYTSLWLLLLNPQLRLTTVEVDPTHAEVARQNLAYAGVGVSERVEVVVGSGTEVLPRLRVEIERGEREKFGFVYLDADKVNNWTYFDLAVGMCVPGTTVWVDNVVLRGALVDEELQALDPRIKDAVGGAKKLIEEAGKDPRVEAVVLQTVGEKNYDGILMAVVL